MKLLLTCVVAGIVLGIWTRILTTKETDT